MSQVPHETISVPNPEISTDSLHAPPLSYAPSAQIGDGHHLPQSVQNPAPNDLSNFVDGSGPIFSMYMEMATEEDKKIVENWKADADGILIFVRLSSNLIFHTSSMGIDWSILRCCRIFDLSVNSGHPTKPTGYLQFLPRQYLSGHD